VKRLLTYPTASREMRSPQRLMDAPPEDEERPQTDAESEPDETDDDTPGFGFTAVVVAFLSLVAGFYWKTESNRID